MRAYLVRVGIDQAFGKWSAPIDPRTGAFVYVPIPEKAGTAFQPGMATDYTPFRSALDIFAAAHPNTQLGTCTPPEALNDLSPHLDPDFDRLTYGDNGLRRGKGLCDLGAGDLVVFFAACVRSINANRGSSTGSSISTALPKLSGCGTSRHRVGLKTLTPGNTPRPRRHHHPRPTRRLGPSEAIHPHR